MKLQPSSCRLNAGYTVAEMMVAMGVFGLLGGIFFAVLNSGMVLFAKNAAVNSAHEETRQGINRLTRDIHASISVPQLRDASFAVTSAQPPPAAAPAPTPIYSSGVSFQNIGGGPYYIWQDPGNASLIKIKDFNVQPQPGMRLIVPFWGLEDNITSCAANGTANHTNVFLQNGWNTTLPRPDGGAYAIVYYTDRVMYCVLNGRYVKDPDGIYTTKDGKNNSASVADPNNWMVEPPSTHGNGKSYRYEGGELHLYKQRYDAARTPAFYWKDVAVVARDLTTPLPFYVPLNSGATANTKYVGVKLAATDSKANNRNYTATSSLLDTQIDYRAAITTSQ